MDASKLSVRIVQLQSEQRFKPLSGPVFPSFPCPVVNVSGVEIRNIRLGPQDVGYICDVTCQGSVKSALSGTLASNDATIEKCHLFVNGSERPVAALPLITAERGLGSAVTSAPFTGGFNVEVKGVRVTEGNNTFKVVAVDKVYGMEGSGMWAAKFVMPDSDDDDEKAVKAAAAKPAFAEKPAPVSGGTGGEVFLYGLMIDGVTPADASKLTLTIGNKSPINCSLIAAGNEGSYLAKRPDTDLPLLFSFRPSSPDKTDSEVDKMADEKGVNASLFASLPEREAFLAAFSIGFFYYGADVVAGTKTTAVRAVDFSPVTGVLTLHSHLSLDNRSVRDFATPLPTKFEARASPVGNPMTTPELAWHLARLYRSDDPRVKEVTLALLLGNFKDVGLESLKIEDWRSELFVVLAETLDSLFEETKRMPSHDQGYLIGRTFCEVARLCMTPGTRLHLGTTPKSEILQQLLKSRFFNEAKTLSPAKAKKTSIWDALKNMFGL